MGVELRRKLNREIDGHRIIVGRYIVIHDVDEAVSIPSALDTRTDYVNILLAEST